MLRMFPSALPVHPAPWDEAREEAPGRLEKCNISLAGKICPYFLSPVQWRFGCCSNLSNHNQATKNPASLLHQVVFGVLEESKGGLKTQGNAWKRRLEGKKRREESLTIGESFISLQSAGVFWFPLNLLTWKNASLRRGKQRFFIK